MSLGLILSAEGLPLRAIVGLIARGQVVLPGLAGNRRALPGSDEK